MSPDEALPAAHEECADALVSLVDALKLAGRWPSDMCTDDRCIACRALLAADHEHKDDCPVAPADAALASWDEALALEDVG